jgi:LysR family nitrogen assimilation transcriptional regulator
MPLATEALGLVGPAGMLDPSQPRDFADLAKLPLILTSDKHGLGKVIHEQARRTGTVLNVRATVDSVTEIKRLVAMGIGYTVLAPLVYSEEVAHGVLSATALQNPTLMRQLVTAQWRAKMQDVQVKRVRELIHGIDHYATMAADRPNAHAPTSSQ